ncbi:hypothetical protein KY362_07570 [Candidatus Woesearchaeota archaeon]|nr:hypothetical protein [Candidatus Woesearchaeota archaeon]
MSMQTMESSVRQDRQWEYYLARPFSLFGASLWHLWFISDERKAISVAGLPESLFIETSRGFVKLYVDAGQCSRFKKDCSDMKDPAIVVKRAIELNKRAEEKLERKEHGSLRDELGFMERLGLYACSMPYWVVELGAVNDELLKEECIKLRSISYYPRVIKEIITPLAREELGQDVDLLTIGEVLKKDTSQLESRRQMREQGKFFILSYKDGVESVDWTDDPLALVDELEGVEDADILKGAVAFKGNVEGAVRLVLSGDIRDFNEGDVLVAASTNPNILPIMKKASAIVTDEGGALCHAAIVSRELRIPCIIGTKNATKLLKDGDRVIVNATSGTVRVIKRA